MEQDGKGTTKERKRGWENEQKKKTAKEQKRWKGGKIGREERREEERK